MNDNELNNLIEKYKNGTCSDDEKKSLDAYLNSFQTSNLIWNEKELGKEKLVRDEIFEKIENRLAAIDRIQHKQFSKSSYIIKIAASSVLLFVLGYFVFNLIDTKKENNVAEIKWHEKTTRIGEKSTITFLDGTKITLNADSKLKYSNMSIEGKREVYLDGEAYFEVSPNKELPFIVHSGGLSTKVLGTKFNVKAFDAENEIVVSLVEGRVTINSNSNEKTLSSKQQLTYDTKTGKEKISSFNFEEVIGWKENVLVFNNVSLEKALVKIERAYGVKFELTDESIKRLRINANFENESLWTIVKVIKSATKLEYMTISDNDTVSKIIFYRKK
ncbi:MAG: FecR domain-containing protein [Ignavibacteriaceae bacterium]|nr:FecR domain-containing protein [Ignavibacteriaceae bacterium]